MLSSPTNPSPFLPFLSHGQAIYDGHIQDAGTRNELSEVNIQLLGSDIETQSNFYGDFLLKNTKTDALQFLSNSYRFFNNAMIWEGQFDIDLEIFAVDGRLLVQEQNLGIAGSYLFPTLSTGLYFLRVSTKNEKQSFKTFSNGERMVTVEKATVWHRSSVP
jgi:hypothetical protein